MSGFKAGSRIVPQVKIVKTLYFLNQWLRQIKRGREQQEMVRLSLKEAVHLLVEVHLVAEVDAAAVASKVLTECILLVSRTPFKKLQNSKQAQKIKQQKDRDLNYKILSHLCFQITLKCSSQELETLASKNK